MKMFVNFSQSEVNQFLRTGDFYWYLPVMESSQQKEELFLELFKCCNMGDVVNPGPKQQDVSCLQGLRVEICIGNS